jgi:hypothetical protein
VKANITRTFGTPLWLLPLLPTLTDGGGGYTWHEVGRDVLHVRLDPRGVKRLVVTEEREVTRVILKVSLWGHTEGALRSVLKKPEKSTQWTCETHLELLRIHNFVLDLLDPRFPY